MQALILEQQDGKTLSSVQTIDASQLPQGDVTVDIHWSSLNYKDALAITGKGKIIRNFPMIPGIDFAGSVHSSEDPRFHSGQKVLLTGWGVGENHWGGLAERARVTGRMVELSAQNPAEIEQHLGVLRQAGVRVEDLEIRKADLEDVFINLMQGRQTQASAAITV